MRLRNLRDDLDAIDDCPGAAFDDLRIYYAALYSVARRVANLSDDCPMCHDGGVAVTIDGIPGCPRCFGTGVVPHRDLLDRIRYPHDPAPGIEAHNERFRVAFDLIRYLFGGDG